jgi:competence protein ComEC
MPSYALDTVKGILWGDKLEDESLYDNLTTIGASHILSVSGLHVGYVYLLLAFLFKRTKVNIKIQTAVILLVLFVYAAMCAFSVSIIRACIMFGVIQCCKICKKLYDPLSSLSFAAIIILAINPVTLFTASFQLSFGAVGGIIFFARVLNNKTGEIKLKILRNSVQIIALTICVQLATLPIILYHFSKISLISVFANVIIIPLCGIIVISSFIGMLLCFLPFMGFYFSLLTYEIKALVYFADLFSKVNYANISLDKMFISEIIVFYILLFLLFGYIILKIKKQYI